MAIPTFTIVYDVDSESSTYGKFLLNDTSDYAGVGVNPADIEGYFIISYPDGNSYTGSQSSPDILPSVDTLNDVIPIPQDANGNWLTGNFTFTYYIYNTNLLTTLSSSTTYDYCPPFLFLEDAEATIESTTDCFQYKINVEDTTDYGTPTTETYLLSLYPPQPLIDSGDASIVTSNTTTLAYTFGYTGTYVATVNTLVTYVTGTVTVRGRVKGDKDISVQCSINICNLINCYNDKLRKLSNQLKNDGYLDSVDNGLKTDLILASLYLWQFKESSACGKYVKATAAYDKLVVLLDCDCGCDEAPANDIRLVNPDFDPAGTITYSFLGTSPVQVSVNTVGNNTTVTYSLTAGFIASVTTAIADITAIEGDIVTIEADIVTLQSDVATLQAGVLNQVVANAEEVAVPNTSTYTTVLTYTNAVGSENGTEWEGDVNFLQTALPVTQGFRLRINTVAVATWEKGTLDQYGNIISAQFRVKKQSNTKVQISALFYYAFSFGTINDPNTVTEALQSVTEAVVADLSANTLVIDVQAKSSNATLELTAGNIKKYTKV